MWPYSTRNFPNNQLISAEGHLHCLLFIYLFVFAISLFIYFVFVCCLFEASVMCFIIYIYFLSLWHSGSTSCIIIIFLFIYYLFLFFCCLFSYLFNYLLHNFCHYDIRDQYHCKKAEDRKVMADPDCIRYAIWRICLFLKVVTLEKTKCTYTNIFIHTCVCILLSTC